MWWLYSIYDFAWPLLTLKELLKGTTFEKSLIQFLMLGIVPGTNWQVSFGDIILAIWFAAFIFITYRLFVKAQKIINKINPYRRLPSNLTYISLISL